MKEITFKGYIARDSGRGLYFYEGLPKRCQDVWLLDDEKRAYTLTFDDDHFPEIQWEDEPVECEINITLNKL